MEDKKASWFVAALVSQLRMPQLISLSGTSCTDELCCVWWENNAGKAVASGSKKSQRTCQTKVGFLLLTLHCVILAKMGIYLVIIVPRNKGL
jgi:hypothetical protein